MSKLTNQRGQKGKRQDRKFTMDEARAIRAYWEYAKLCFPEALNEQSLAKLLSDRGLPTLRAIGEVRGVSGYTMWRMIKGVSWIEPCPVHPRTGVGGRRCDCGLNDEQIAIIERARAHSRKAHKRKIQQNVAA